MARAPSLPATGAGLLEHERRRRAWAHRASGLRAPGRRAIWVLALLCTGLVIGRDDLADSSIGVGSAGLFLAGGLAALVGMCARGWWVRGFLSIGVVCAGAGWSMLNVVERPAGDVARWLGTSPVVVTVEGMVEESPRVTGTQRGALAEFARHDRRVARFVLRIARVVGRDGVALEASGRMFVRVDGPSIGDEDRSDSFAAGLARGGEWVRVTGMATGVRGPSNPGENDFRPIAADRGISGSVRCTSAELVERIESPGGLGARTASWSARLVDEMRGSARRVLRDAVGEESSQREALLGALLLGERDGRYHDLSAPFVRLGVTHVLAISGLHVGIFVGFVALLVRLTGDRWRTEALVVLLAVGFMMVLIPARAPVVRACAIIAGFTVAGLAGRRYDALNTLAWIAVGVLLWRPTELWSPGFQLSFLIVAALIGLTGALRERVFGVKTDPDHRSAWERVRYGGEDALCASCCAWLVSLPLVMHHFGVVTMLAPLVSLLVLPLVGVLLVMGYALIGVAWFAPQVAGIAGAVVGSVGGLLLGGVAMLDGLPGATFRVPEVGWVWAAVGTGMAWVALWRGVRGRPLVVALLIVVAVWPVFLVARGVVPGGAPGLDKPGLPPDGLRSSRVVLRWDVLDVGDGSAHIVRSGGEAMMFDCGSSWYGIGERALPRAARALGAWRVGTVVISHPDGDHYSGLLDCVEPLGVRRVVVGAAFVEESARGDGPAGYVLGELTRMGVKVVVVGAGDELRLGGEGGSVVRFVSPRVGFGWERDNDASLVALVSARGGGGREHVRLLLTGDIERDAMGEVEEALSGLGVDRVDGMEAPHHGSARSFAFGFVEGLRPRVVVQSTGVSRLGDERWDDVKEGMGDWFITARDGAVSVWFGGDGGVRTRVWGED